MQQEDDGRWDSGTSAITVLSLLCEWGHPNLQQSPDRLVGLFHRKAYCLKHITTDTLCRLCQVTCRIFSTSVMGSDNLLAIFTERVEIGCYVPHGTTNFLICIISEKYEYWIPHIALMVINCILLLSTAASRWVSGRVAMCIDLIIYGSIPVLQILTLQTLTNVWVQNMSKIIGLRETIF